MLRVLRGLRFVRRWLPDWHREENEFRDWYLGLLPLFPQMTADARKYDRFVAVLKLPMEVTGYREIRYPKMRAARAQAAELLAESPAASQPVRTLAAA
jgi:indolepyruvate ferredoxin oxidoreductase